MAGPCAGFVIGLAGAGTVAWASAEEAACCLGDSTCQILHHNDCVDQGGEPYPAGSTCESITCPYFAWLQPPLLREEEPFVGCYEKWEETTVRHGDQLVADDFVLVETAPITAIHWWGSYRFWFETLPPPNAHNFFYLSLWSHIDGDPETPSVDFPRPETVLHEWYVPRANLSEVYTTCTVDSSNASVFGSAFFYRWTVPEEVRFTAQAGVRYWLSIAAALIDPNCGCDADVAPPFGTYDEADLEFVKEHVGCPVGTGDPDCEAADVNCDGVVDDQDVFIAYCQSIFGFADPECCLRTIKDNWWGWVAREHEGLHEAVRITSPTDPTVGSTFANGFFIVNSDGERVELAFVLITSPPTVPPPGSPPPSCFPEHGAGDQSGLPLRELSGRSCWPELE